MTTDHGGSTMKGTKAGDRGEYEFTRAAYDELKDAERRFQVEFDIALVPTGQRGVWALVMSARAKGEGEVLMLAARYTATWPNSTAVSFGAFEYQCCHRLCRMVESWHDQRELDEAAR
jgi:hypothetical protein